MSESADAAPMQAAPADNPRESTDPRRVEPSEALEVVRAQDVPLQVLISAAQPLLEAYFAAQRDQSERELAFQERLLSQQAAQNRTILRGLFVLAGGVLLIAAFLMYRGRDDSAVDLIQLVVALGGAALGGYGLAMKPRVGPPDSDG